MSYKILEVPEVPEKIIEAVNANRLAVFVGAGVSRLVGCKSWRSLSNSLIDICFNTKTTEDISLISYKEKEFLKKQDPKKIITICNSILEKHKESALFVKCLEDSLNHHGKVPVPNVYDEIHKLRGLFLTTNADKHFDRLFEKDNRIFEVSKMRRQLISRKNLYHIHGSIEAPSSLVFTIPQYLNRYSDDTFGSFLSEIFNNYTVLFLGYGLEEFEVLDYLVTKSHYSPDDNDIRHYILLGLFKGEENLLDHEEAYYRNFGIGVEAYQMDEKGYDQVVDVLRSWNSEIERISRYIVDSFDEIEEIKNGYSTEKANGALQLIRNDTPQRVKFFRILSEVPDPEKWLPKLSEKEFLNPKFNPSPVESDENKGYFTIPYWEIIGFLENLSKRNSEDPSSTTTKKIKKIIKSIAEYRDDSGKRIENYHTDWAVFKLIFSLPKDKITAKHIDYVSSFLGGRWNDTLIGSELSKIAFPRLAQEKNAKSLVTKLLKVTFSFKVLDKPHYKEVISLLDSYWLKEAVVNNRAEIVRVLGGETSLTTALATIKSVLKKSPGSFNNVWIPTIDDSQERLTDRYDSIVVDFCRYIIEQSSGEISQNTVKSLLRSKHSILRRLGLYAIRVNYRRFKGLFWGFFSCRQINKIDQKHELYSVFQDNSHSFTKAQLSTIISCIENMSISRDRDISNQQRKQFTAYLRKEWLSSLVKSNDQTIQKLFEKYDAINPATLEHPGHSTWSEGGWVSERSPIETATLVQKTAKEIADFVSDFKPTGHFRDPSKDGLADTLKQVTKSNPKKILTDIQLFQNHEYIYIHSILSGLEDSWNEQKAISWNRLIQFITEITEKPNFWDTHDEMSASNYNLWIVSKIGDLISSATRDDKHAADPSLIPEFETLLLKLLPKTPSGVSDYNDVVTATLNTALGKLVTATILMSLRHARVEGSEDPVRWTTPVKEYFSSAVVENPAPELSVSLGKYIRQMFYLDEKWYRAKLGNIFPSNNDQVWECAFTGYLFYSSQVSKAIYEMFKEHGDYAKALEFRFKDDQITERVSQHIGVGYLQGYESLEDPESLIVKLLESGNAKIISGFVTYFRMIRENLDDVGLKKMLDVWPKLNTICLRHPEDPDFKTILANMVGFLEMVPKLSDRVIELLTPILPYAAHNHGHLRLPEMLYKHAADFPEEVGNLYRVLLENNIYLTYREEVVVEIVETIYAKGYKATADSICNGYFAKNIEFLRGVFDRHQDGGQN